jgi:tetratricopeptide (TPR) repeat protein
MKMHMKRSVFLTVVLLMAAMVGESMANVASAPDTTKNIIDKGKITVALAKARNMFLGNDVRGALQEYKNVNIDDPQNAVVHFRIGECHYYLKNYATAIESLEESRAMDPAGHKELDHVFGMTYHKLERLDEAIECFTRFKATLKNDKLIEEFQVQVYIDQCKLAKEQMKSPVNAQMKNMGRAINSRHPDYNPVISPDGKTLLITSRRQDTKGGGRTEYDKGFYSDVYQSNWNAETSSWSELEKISGKVNTEEWDAANCFSADGMYLYITRNIELATKSSDIYFTKLSGSGKWGTPKSIGKAVNSSYFESSATLTADEQVMYFITERPGGIGRGDIWKVEKISRREWGEAVNLGASANTPDDENTVWVSPDGKYLFYSSKGPGGLGGSDIYRAEIKDGVVSAGVNLGYPINTVWDESHFKISADGKTAYCTATRPNGLGDHDVYTIDLTNYPLMNGPLK